MELARRQQAKAIVQDWRSAVVAFSGADLSLAPQWAEAELALQLPTALVVSPAVVDLFREHARRMATHGIFRRVFAEPEGARQWAQARLSAG